MYQHADQTWKEKPRVLSEENQQHLIRRLDEYTRAKDLKEIVVIYHGGEPLLFGAENLVRLTNSIRGALLDNGCKAHFGIQTNAVLLTKEILDMFEENKMTVSVSIDGPQRVHDIYRLDHKGRPTFDKVFKGLQILKQYPNVFSGCLAVINPEYSARELFEFFEENEIRDLNFLLPDANYLAPPKGRDEQPNLYTDWLIDAFDCWFHEYPHIRCKLFESIIKSIFGQEGQDDSLGLGEVSLLNIETDGSYHDLDVLKIVADNYSALDMNLRDHEIIEAEQSPKIQKHTRLLRLEGLSQTCQQCKFATICGGGSVPHRYDGSFTNPTVYCQEMYALIDHMMKTMDQHLSDSKNSPPSHLPSKLNEYLIDEFWDSETSASFCLQLQDHRIRKDQKRLTTCLINAPFLSPTYQADVRTKICYENLKNPVNRLWISTFETHLVNSSIKCFDGTNLPFVPKMIEALLYSPYDREHEFEIHRPHRLYHGLLGRDLSLDLSPEELGEAKSSFGEALRLVLDYRPSLIKEMHFVSPFIFFLKNLDEKNPRDISFSDEMLPGALFIGIKDGERSLHPFEIAASLVHEHHHQKLYLLQERYELFLPQETFIYSPWPKKMRKPSDVLHAVYVFTHVAYFLFSLLQKPVVQDRVQTDFMTTMDNLDRCISEIEEKVKFTSSGQLLFSRLLSDFQQLKQDTLVFAPS